MNGSEAINTQVEMMLPKENSSPHDGRDSHNGVKGGGGSGHSLGQPARVQPPQGLNLTQYAAAKGLDREFLKNLGLADSYPYRKPALRIPYQSEDGLEVAVQFRLSMDGDKRFRWTKGSQPHPYGLWKLGEARAAGYICLVNGTSDPHTLWSQGIPALGLPGDTPWREEWADHLRGVEKIYIATVSGKGNEGVKQWLRNSRIQDRAWLVTIEGANDASQLYLHDQAGFKNKWTAALASASPWQELERADKCARAKVVWPRCEELATQPNILDRWEKALRRRFVVGEGCAARLLYLALTSRFLDRPVSVVVKGPSSCGKSFLTEQVLGFFPPSAFYVLTAMSEKALAYSDEPIKHRFVVILEAAGLQGEWAEYFVRSLLSEGRICYETVEKTKDGLRPRRIEREGPAGLITTTTEIDLHPENETRFFSVEVDDTPDHTREVLKATAGSINGDDARACDEELGMFLALQEWLADVNHDVVIPYAGVLADKTRPVAVRMRRDFKAILHLIKSHAILHQASREVDGRGRIIATLEDYKPIRDLVAPIVSQGVEVTVSPAIRETVEAVRELGKRGGEGVSVREVADALELDSSSASRRIAACVRVNYLVNLQHMRGQPFKLIEGDPLPGEEPVLPDPESLVEDCSVAGGSEGVDSPLPCTELSGSGVTPKTEEVL